MGEEWGEGVMVDVKEWGEGGMGGEGGWGEVEWGLWKGELMRVWCE